MPSRAAPWCPGGAILDRPASSTAPLPAFVRPQLAKLVKEAPEGDPWAHELKFDGYRMHARIDRGRVQLIMARSGLDWTSKYPATAEALKRLPVARAYLDGELCAMRPDGTMSFSLMQARPTARAPPGSSICFRRAPPRWRGSVAEAAP